LIFIFVFVSSILNAQTIFILDKIPEYTPTNAHVFIAGSLNNWNAADSAFELTKSVDGKYSIQLNYSSGTYIEFKFTLGSWNTVEKNSNGKEISNRNFTFNGQDTLNLNIANWANVDNPEITHTATDNVSILTDSFFIPQFKRYRRIWIYLPPDYQQTNDSFPVIYMHDGQNLFDAATSFSGEWNADESTNELIASGKQENIIVGIDNGGIERINELTPYTNSQYGGGSGELYLNFIVDNLKPYIDSVYRTKKQRENTTIWGSSLGGLISLYGVLKYNNVFGKAGIYSPSLWFNDSIYRLAENFTYTQSTFIYFLAGGQEGDGTLGQQCQKYINILKSKGFSDKELKLKEVASGAHNEAFWRSQYKDTYNWLFPSTTNILSKKKLKIRIYPNPAGYFLNVEYDENQGDLKKCEIYDLNGRFLFNKNFYTSKFQLNLRGFKKGCYFFKISSLNTNYTEKIYIK